MSFLPSTFVSSTAAHRAVFDGWILWGVKYSYTLLTGVNSHWMISVVLRRTRMSMRSCSCVPCVLGRSWNWFILWWERWVARVFIALQWCLHYSLRLYCFREGNSCQCVSRQQSGYTTIKQRTDIQNMIQVCREEFWNILALTLIRRLGHSTLSLSVATCQDDTFSDCRDTTSWRDRGALALQCSQAIRWKNSYFVPSKAGLIWNMISDNLPVLVSLTTIRVHARNVSGTLRSLKSNKLCRLRHGMKSWLFRSSEYKSSSTIILSDR